MKPQRNDVFAEIGVIILMLLFFILFSLPGYVLGRWAGYKEGQIDAYNGVYQYELIENEDGSRTWSACSPTREKE